MKIKITNKYVWRRYFELIGKIGTILGIASIFFSINDSCKMFYGFITLICLIILLILIILKANYESSIRLIINGKKVNIYFGDIFESNGLKLIPFNEYFDTQVDDSIISKKSLNGKFIEKFYSNVTELDNCITEALKLKSYVLNTNRSVGKNIKYPLGTTIEIQQGYLLSAFTHFDERNRAFLAKGEYIQYLNNMWDEINVIYASRNINIPLIGSGITRVGVNMTLQDYLEQILFSIKFSDIKMDHMSCINIILHKSIKDEINLFNVKNNFK
jgi:hypothetical protein